jgi:hypothetical protein
LATWDEVVQEVLAEYKAGSPEYDWISNILEGKYSGYVTVIEAETDSSVKAQYGVTDTAIFFNTAASSKDVVRAIFKSEAWKLHKAALGNACSNRPPPCKRVH